MKHFYVCKNNNAILFGTRLPSGSFYGRFQGIYWAVINPDRRGYNSVDETTDVIIWEKNDQGFHEMKYVEMDKSNPLIKMVLRKMPKERVKISFSKGLEHGDLLAKIMQETPAPRRRKGTAMKEMSRLEATRKQYNTRIRLGVSKDIIPERKSKINRTTDYACTKERYGFHYGYENRCKDNSRYKFDAMASN